MQQHEFSCCPKSIANHLKFWKASEFKNWLLFYSLPILLDYLPSLYVHHYALHVCAMHILLQESIDSSLLDAAEMMLKDFIVFLPGESNCTANAHMLLHLPKYTRLWGPPLDTISFWVRKQKWRFKTQYPRQEHNTSTVIAQHRYISNTTASKNQSFVARESYDYIIHTLLL